MGSHMIWKNDILALMGKEWYLGYLLGVQQKFLGLVMSKCVLSGGYKSLMVPQFKRFLKGQKTWQAVYFIHV